MGDYQEWLDSNKTFGAVVFSLIAGLGAIILFSTFMSWMNDLGRTPSAVAIWYGVLFFLGGVVALFIMNHTPKRDRWKKNWRGPKYPL